MTERWRKKLEGIDQVGPSDDLYRRAKDGPTFPEPQSPMRRTSTRVVTAIAAFVVFALAISLFAVPALRLGGNDRFVSAGNQIQPLWPWNSIDAVQTWRDDPQPIGTTSVDHFSSPEDVATGFGRDVLGWGATSAREQASDVCLPASPTVAGTCSVVLPSGSSPPILLPYAPTTAAPAFRTFQLSPCQLSMTPSCESSLGFIPQITVVVFQPLGDGGPWAVLEARTDLISISLAPGTELRDGSTVYASGVVPRGTRAVLGFNAASEGCGGTGSITGFEETPKDAGSDQEHGIPLGTYSRGQLQIGLMPVDTSCGHRSGYLFVAITENDLGTGDPVGGIQSDVGIIGFAAVPVSFVFPPTGASSGPPSGSSSTEVGWTTYTDKAGWTIDVPAAWSVRKIDGSDAKGTYEGAAFGSASLDQYPGGPPAIGAPPGEVSLILYHGTCTVCPGPGPTAPYDDTQFPLDIANADPVDGGFLLGFQANGIPFSLSIRAGGDAPTPEQMSILERMVSSISFEPWHPGEERDGWTALNPTGQDDPLDQQAKISWQTCDHAGCYVLVYGDYGPGGQGPYVLGPIQPCGEGENMTADPASIFRIVLECPDGSTQAWGAPGEPSSNNSQAYDTALNVLTVIRAWDGTLLADLNPNA